MSKKIQSARTKKGGLKAEGVRAAHARAASLCSMNNAGGQESYPSRVVIEVRGGVVQAVFADCTIGVDVIDLDNAKATSRQAVIEAEEFLDETRKTLIEVY